ncbi:type VI secretion system baseplate subunit TssG [Vibrio sp. Isolate25]|uniref:type VI secretion system baseplate subunit TssG n=1 Tax=Vibrio TaxID=662 RepID=UPI001EFC7BDE|nr:MULTISPECIES: type VI secretion system baseplate subunit TssG [Vibrio]MCG9595580.1 type VI secretion system baseplate subunit TssG [Vibrio sp. Isolate25]MCG9677078.1 type VI secretion system baseplate subunit TssG [Vibrio sp. Isolate24]MCG9681123.1 type VI secretion system baseplate subunit TssG [Vibrio sp. Isolate23]USD34268.1 type VI secretion system baseplate subunit TssG [Vibrio sp. SCSIO 43186]USD47340.1 type VI secretion system baseplate subunit TssG [Vibrio sp. SCSIO 43145]
MINQIEQETHEFGFFQAVSLLEKYYQFQTDFTYQGIGQNKYIAQEHIRFSVSPSLAFPKSDIDYVSHYEVEGNPYSRVEVTFLGLHGSSSPLPSSYTEKLAGRDDEDNPVKQFFDFFHNRHISLVYRVWKKYRYHIQYLSDAKDPFSGRMLHLLGLSSVMQEAEVSELDRAKLLSYVSQLSTRTRSPKLISGIVAHYFSLQNVTVDEWIYRRVAIHQSQRNKLNHMNCVLGHDLHLGKTLPDLVGKFHLRIEDIDFSTYQTFLPGRGNYKTLIGLMQFILRDPLAWDLIMKVKLDTIPKNELGRGEGNLLGQTVWLGQPEQKDASIKQIGQL